MHISKISASAFYGNTPKKVASMVNKVENPVKKFIEETKDFHNFYPYDSLIPECGEIKKTSEYFPPRNLMPDIKPPKNEAVENSIFTDWQQ